MLSSREQRQSPATQKKSEQLRGCPPLPPARVDKCENLSNNYVGTRQPLFMTQRAIVVDDSSFQRNIITNTIENWFEVVGTAKNGREAIDVFREKRPEVITMDIMMPEMNGIDALREIKEISPKTTIVMVTSVSQNEKMQEAARAGADGYVTKPVETKQLREEFDDVFEFPVSR